MAGVRAGSSALPSVFEFETGKNAHSCFLRIAFFCAAECANVQYGCNLVVCCRIGNLVKHLHSNRGDEAARNVASPGIVVRTRHADDHS